MGETGWNVAWRWKVRSNQQPPLASGGGARGTTQGRDRQSTAMTELLEDGRGGETPITGICAQRWRGTATGEYHLPAYLCYHFLSFQTRRPFKPSDSVAICQFKAASLERMNRPSHGDVRLTNRQRNNQEERGKPKSRPMTTCLFPLLGANGMAH